MCQALCWIESKSDMRVEWGVRGRGQMSDQNKEPGPCESLISSLVVRLGELPEGGDAWDADSARQRRGRVFLAESPECKEILGSV